MQSEVASGFLSADDSRRAGEIVRNCVHCGMCAAACPTYILDRDERDSPRGRIYLINEMLRRGEPSPVVLRHLDRCLTCRACESACPSGVRYAELADIGRAAAEPARTKAAKLRQSFVAGVFSNSNLMRVAGGVFSVAGFALPRGLRLHFRRRRKMKFRSHKRKAIMLFGCVEGALSPQTHAALSDVLAAAKIGLLNPMVGCCGALRFHLNRQTDAKKEMRRNVAAWAPLLKSGAADFVVMSASGCQQMVARYGELLGTEDARLVSEKTINAAQLVGREWNNIAPHLGGAKGAAIAYHSPCTMQNGLPLDGCAEELLVKAGYVLHSPPEKGVCCGSAGTYSLLQPARARRLRARKLKNLAVAEQRAAKESVAKKFAAGELVAAENESATEKFSVESESVQFATANIGCQLFLSAASDRPVLHWLELIADAIQSSRCGKEI